jgi:MFS transporter, ACS family, D-galactonate transporter
MSAASPASLGSISAVQPTWVRWRIVALLMAFCFIGHINRLSMRVAGDERLMADFCFTPEQMGLVYSAFLFAYTVCMTPGGWVIDRFGPKATLLALAVGSALFEAATGLGGLAMSGIIMALSSFLLIRTFMGMTNAPLHPGTSRMVPLWIPFFQRGRATGFLFAAAGVGIAGVGLIFGYLIDWVGWRSAFLLMGTITALLAVLWAGYGADRPWQHPSVNAAEQQWITEGQEKSQIPKSKFQSVAEDRASTFRLLRNRSLICLTLSYAAVGYFQYLFFYWMNYYFATVLGLGMEASRFYSSIPPLAMVVGMACGGWFSDLMVRAFGYRIGRMSVPVMGMLMAAGFLYVGVKASEPAWIVLWFSLALGGIGAVESPSWSTAIELGGRQGGTAGGIFNTGGNIGGIIAPILTPWVAESFKDSEWVKAYFGDSWRLGLYLGSLVVLAGVALWFWVDPNERVNGEHTLSPLNGTSAP